MRKHPPAALQREAFVRPGPWPMMLRQLVHQDVDAGPVGVLQDLAHLLVVGSTGDAWATWAVGVLVNDVCRLPAVTWAHTQGHAHKYLLRTGVTQ